MLLAGIKHLNGNNDNDRQLLLCVAFSHQREVKRYVADSSSLITYGEMAYRYADARP